MPEFQPTKAERSAWRFAALERLAATLGALAQSARLVVLFPPVHIAIQPVPGSFEAAQDAECKERVVSIVAAHRGQTVDLRFASPITVEDANYWDALHYRLPIAGRIAEILGEASKGEAGGPDFRVLGKGS